jgi:hypothetical protein
MLSIYIEGVFSMSKNLSLKMDDIVFREAEKTIRRLGKSRNAYINEAVDRYNKYYNKQDLRTLLVRESAAVYESSMEVLKEMEALDDPVTAREGMHADT